LCLRGVVSQCTGVNGNGQGQRGEEKNTTLPSQSVGGRDVNEKRKKWATGKTGWQGRVKPNEILNKGGGERVGGEAPREGGRVAKMKPKKREKTVLDGKRRTRRTCFQLRGIVGLEGERVHCGREGSS